MKDKKKIYIIFDRSIKSGQPFKNRVTVYIQKIMKKGQV